MKLFTKEEVSLCKQIAEKYKKEAKVGDWIKDVIVAQIFLVIRMVQHGSYLECINEEYGLVTRNRNMVDFPLWTISDCLEFLIEKGWDDINIDIAPKWEIQCLAEKGLVAKGYECGVEGWGKTPLEACLKAVLAVLEETQ